MSSLQADRAALVELILEDGPGLDRFTVADAVDRLGRLASTTHRWDVIRCNGGLTDAQEAADDRRMKAAEKLVEKFGPGFGLDINGDPRGAPFKILLPSKRSDSFGGKGWIVPFTPYRGT